jgi:alcohol dehydrogenase (cytochrome c)
MTTMGIDVSTGRKGVIKWKMDPGIDRAWAGDVACCGINNRGVALWKDKVISVSLDGRMFSINKATGEVAWERKIADPALGETLTIAPLVIRDLAIVGNAGGERGIRGFIEATDLNTGKAAGAPIRSRAPANPATKPGKTARNAGDTAAARYGRPRPMIPRATRSARASAMRGPDWDPEYQPGDNKWAASVLAINATDGKIKWGYQYTPNDPYDFDEISEHPISSRAQASRCGSCRRC